MDKVYFAIERRAVFFLPIQGPKQYRRLNGTRTWRHEDKLTEEEGERTGTGSLFLADVASNIIGQLFGFEKNITTPESALIETCDGGPDWTFTIDLDKSPWTLKSLEAACQHLSDLINNGENFQASEPRTANCGSDPVVTYADFDVPSSLRKMLKRRKKCKSLTDRSVQEPKCARTVC